MNKILEKSPLIGASIAPGLKSLQNFAVLKLGNVVLSTLPDDESEALLVADFCRKNGIYFMLAEIVHRHNHKRWHSPNLSYEAFGRIFQAFGDYFLGRYAIGEAGGICYWPKSYTIDEAVECYRNMPPCNGEIQAHKVYVDYLKKELEFERSQVAPGTLFNVESSILFARHCEAGIDGQCLEMLPGDPLITLAAIRGAARAFGMLWGVHIAMLWYGGIRIDEMWLKRWKQSLYISYLSGADFIYPESGHMEYQVNGSPEYDFASPEMKRVRLELRKLHAISQLHEHNKPLTPLAIVQGSDDGHPGIWNPYCWGQYNNGRKWESSDAERSWELFETFFRKEDLFHGNVTGSYDFSGNPPCGAIDVIPPEADFNNYRMLIFLGLNRMDDDLYNKLIEFVKNGGHLFISLAHFDTSQTRCGALELFNRGDLHELTGFKVKDWYAGDVCGVKFIKQPSAGKYDLPVQTPERDPFFIGYIKGAEIVYQAGDALQILAGLSDNVYHTKEEIAAMPLLVEHCLGKGAVYTLTAAEYPGSNGLKAFSNCLLRAFTRGIPRPLELLAPDTVRYAICELEEPGDFAIHIFNCNADLSGAVKVFYQGHFSQEIFIRPNAFKIIYVMDGILLDLPDELSTLQKTEGSRALIYYGRKQTVSMENLADSLHQFTINGLSIELAPGKTGCITIAENLPRDKEHFFLQNYLEEPILQEIYTATPY